MTESNIVEDEAIGRAEPDGTGHDMAQESVVVPLGNIDVVECHLEALEEPVHVPPLGAWHPRNEVFYITEDHEPRGSVLLRECLDFRRHSVRLRREVDTGLAQCLLEADVEVRDREDRAVDEEGGVVRDRPEVHRGVRGHGGD